MRGHLPGAYEHVQFMRRLNDEDPETAEVVYDVIDRVIELLAHGELPDEVYADQDVKQQYKLTPRQWQQFKHARTKGWLKIPRGDNQPLKMLWGLHCHLHDVPSIVVVPDSGQYRALITPAGRHLRTITKRFPWWAVEQVANMELVGTVRSAREERLNSRE